MIGKARVGGGGDRLELRNDPLGWPSGRPELALTGRYRPQSYAQARQMCGHFCAVAQECRSDEPPEPGTMCEGLVSVPVDEGECRGERRR